MTPCLAQPLPPLPFPFFPVTSLLPRSAYDSRTLLLENNHGQGMDAFVAKIAGKWQVVR